MNVKKTTRRAQSTQIIPLFGPLAPPQGMTQEHL